VVTNVLHHTTNAVYLNSILTGDSKLNDSATADIHAAKYETVANPESRLGALL
jgi:hypothetical protein